MSGKHAGSSRILDGSQAAADAILCLSELVTNATVHSRSRRPGGHFTVHAAIHAGLCASKSATKGVPGPGPDAAGTSSTDADYSSSPS